MKLNVVVLTISSSASKGERKDASGAAILDFVKARNWQIIRHDIVADDEHHISEYLKYICDTGVPDLVLTTGGTGLSRDDRTPEATRKAIDREVPGIAEAMRMAGRETTPTAILSRQVAGIRGETLIVNLPGSPVAVSECLEVIGDILGHACDAIRGEAHDSGSG
ncbi:MAG: MogA/MoaB family molybdenum cofactor biosynthesis protein [bacterium]|jgi:molybdenum cofactor synthesis domain-containing protein